MDIRLVDALVGLLNEYTLSLKTGRTLCESLLPLTNKYVEFLTEKVFPVLEKKVMEDLGVEGDEEERSIN